jgi:hypothetical protein
MGVIEKDPTTTDNAWESVKKGNDDAIERWINAQIFGKSCAIVLIGSQTAGRKWIDYEIKKCWDEGKGLLGIHIHNLLDVNRQKTSKGENPFNAFSVGTTPLSSLVSTYDPPSYDSKTVYGYIRDNLESWIDAAVTKRNKY